MGSPTLPSFPWDTLAPYLALARDHPEGLVDLSVGTPRDHSPKSAQDALGAAADAPGYPTTHGTADFREAVADWYRRHRGVSLDPADVLPTLGSKEFVAWLPSLLGLGPGDVVVHPEVAYPTYEVGARLAGAEPLPADDVAAWGGRDDVRLVWLNSPANPTGAVLGVEELREVVTAARRIGAVVAGDECYAMFPWEEPWSSSGVPSVLHPQVCQARHDLVLSIGSLSKQATMAGYRAAWVAGDPALVGRLLELRKHAGMMMPTPVQAAAAVALADDAHVLGQRERYGRRRQVLRAAFEATGLVVEPSPAGLYLWVRPDGPGQDCWLTVAELAKLGILVAPGSFYGAAGARHVRVSLTASDSDVERAAARLAGA